MNLDRDLKELENGQLIRRAADDDLAYLFKHTLTQETAYRSLLAKKRREIHRQVAHAYESLYPADVDEHAALLAQHYYAAGDTARTLHYAELAGDVAARLYANSEAAASFQLALAVAREAAPPDPAVLARLYVRLGRMIELQSRFDDAARLYDEMEQTALALGDPSFQLAALIAKAVIRSIPGSAREPTEARTLAHRALELARRLGDRPAEARILWILLLLDIYSGGNAREAIACGEQSLAIARELGLREQIAFTLNDLFAAYTYVGDLERALQVRKQASLMWRELDNRPMLAESLTGLGILQAMRGDLSGAQAQAEEAYAIGRAIENLGSKGFAGYVLSLIHLDRGETARALSYSDDARLITDSGGLEGPGVSGRGARGWIYAQIGDWPRARAELQRAMELANPSIPLLRMWLCALQTRVELSAGDVAAARAAFQAGPVVPSLENYQRTFPLGGPVFCLAAAELALASSAAASAVECMDWLLSYTGEIGFRLARPEALLVRGRALLARGERDKAIENFNEAKELAAAIGLRRILWPVLLELGRAQQENGDPRSAETNLRQAREIVMYITDHTPPELAATFKSARLAQQVLAGE